MRKAKAIVRIFVGLILPAGLSMAGCAGQVDSTPKGHLHSYYYESFDEEQRQIYDLFDRSACDPFSGELLAFEEEYTAPLQEVNAVYQGFLYDHPEYFWLGGSFQYERLENEAGEYDDSLVSAVAVVPVLDREELEDAETALQVEVNRICEEIDRLCEEQTADSEEALVRIIYDILLESVSYEERAVYDAQLQMEHTAYGALVNGRAVCDGYALAFRYLLSIYGVECVLIPGEYAGAAHVWTTVFWDGDWHEIDPTMDDDRVPRYYDLTTKEMEVDHRREQVGIALLAPRSYS